MEGPVPFFLGRGLQRERPPTRTTNRAGLSIAAETSSYLGKVGANLRGFKLERRKICPPKTAFYYGQR